MHLFLFTYQIKIRHSSISWYLPFFSTSSTTKCISLSTSHWVWSNFMSLTIFVNTNTFTKNVFSHPFKLETCLLNLQESAQIFLPLSIIFIQINYHFLLLILYPTLLFIIVPQKLQEFQCLLPLLNHEVFEGKNCVLYP